MSELPDGWSIAHLDDVATVKMGQSPDSRFYNEEHKGLPFFQGKAEFGDLYPSVRKWCSVPSKTAYAGDILLSVRAPVGPTNLAAEECCIGRGLAAIRANGDFSQTYLLHFFRHIQPWLSEQGTGSTFTAVSGEFVRNLSLPIAPANEQRRIVAKIEALQARSRKAREALEAIPPLLEQFRQSVLAAAFRGDLTADWREQHPDVEPASVLLDRIRAERRRKWEEAELAKFQAKGKVPKDDSWKEKYVEPAPVDDADLPELPEGWCWAAWNDLSEWITYGFTRPMPHVKDGIPIVTAKNVVDGTIQFDDTHFTTVEAFRALSDKDRPEPGDILITKDGTIGRAGVVPEGKTFCINQSVAVVYLRSCPIDRRYLLRLIEAPMTQEPIREKARGMALQHLSITDFGRMAVPLPPIAEQRKIVNRLESQMARIERVSREMQDATNALMECDQAILAKAFRGELVPQDPDDEPASVLLERIRAERADDANGKPSRGRRKRSKGQAKST